LFPLPAIDADINPYTATPDGKRLLALNAPEHGAQPLTMIVNWPALLKKAVY
jgi:hypothetical protein